MSLSSKIYGIMAEYKTPADAMHAAEKVRDAGFRRWDVFTPFPVHGMDKAMGLGNSRVGWFAFIGGVTGYATGMLMIWWMNAVDYQIVIGGKPMFSPFGAFPPSYELTILFSAFGAIGGTTAEPNHSVVLPAPASALNQERVAPLSSCISSSSPSRASMVHTAKRSPSPRATARAIASLEGLPSSEISARSTLKRRVV